MLSPAQLQINLCSRLKTKDYLSGNPITIAVANGDVGQRFIIRLKQDNTGSRTVNWFSTISWPGGGPPALSTATGVADLLGFVVTAANEYDGFIMVSGIY